jgi:hypothetical protein
MEGRAEQQWQREMAPHFKCKMGAEVDAVPVDAVGLKVWDSTQSQRFQRNMIKAQWAVAQIVRHYMVESIVKWFDHELYCILGLLGCSLETRTAKARTRITNRGCAGCEQVCSSEHRGGL